MLKILCGNRYLFYICIPKTHTKRMEAKEPASRLLKALQEIGRPAPRQLLLDYMMGRRTRQIEELELYDNETYGTGETHDEDFWSAIIDAAYENGLIKQMTAENGDLLPTAAGKKFSKKPSSLVLPDDESISAGVSDVSEIDSLLEQAGKDHTASEIAASPNAKRQIKLIMAIDRHVALEDFAESEGLGLDEVLGDLESLAQQKRRLNITYFTDEVLGSECMEELLEYFREAKSDSIEQAVKEYGDVYNEAELRLARIVHLMNAI